MNQRIVLLFTLLAVSYVAVQWIGSGQDASVAPAIDVADIPVEIGDWVGEDVEIRDDTIQVLNAQSFISRIYRDPTGHAISMHVANWTNPNTISAAPHHPEICFAGAGWSLLDRRTTEFPTARGNVPIELILFQKGQQRVVSGHWFRVGEVTHVDFQGFQNQRSKFWGKKSWPDTTKFLFQLSSPSLKAAEESIKSFASKVADASQLKG